ncbi:flagellar biosynthesis protein FlhF [Mangrovimicrobium sediminis]|uniref:Flagellar biosynthesis protein FlhF n=1 Tax=Mangrovimicrobium sediminis TaxID=2562682 RepID=A0A4Z0LUU8_9GAMM|nr:flagellar biosynthesis protein FlhF [Haliea sp. SAOS-164]TGD70835.1 flagellar biosynthesis protein FlhF [Haliea sp. SAOS-164]
MNVQRFVGVNSREAMRKVKAALGENALILGNHSTPEGIEILAVAESEVPGAAPATPQPVAPAAALVEPEPVVPLTPIAVKPASEAGGGQLGEQLMAEVRDVKAMLAASAARMQGADTNGGRLYRGLLTACFSDELAAELAVQLPEPLQQAAWQPLEIRKWLSRQLELRLPPLADGEGLVDAGGVFALVGPTGSGKTTTTAKIAARYVMRHGAEDLALVSTDYYRVGAHEQLREYASLLDVTFRAVDSQRPLAQVLEELRDKRVVLIDTVGLSQRDERVLGQFAELCEACDDLRFVLLLSGSSHHQTLEEVVRCYRQSALAAGGRIGHCILTKLDEACSPALLVDKVIRHDLQPLFSSAGQRVPEDLDPAMPMAIMQPVLRQLTEEPAAPFAEPPARPADWTRELLSRGRQIGVNLRLLEASVPGFGHLEALWDISLLHTDWQQARVDDLRAGLRGQVTAGGALWAEEAHGEDDIAWPHLLLDADLRPSAITVPPLQNVPAEGRLAALEAQLGSRVHLFPSLPESAALHWLRERDRRWLAAVSARTQVQVRGTAQAVSKAVPADAVAGEIELIYRSQPAILSLSGVPAVFPPVRESVEVERYAGFAWAGVLRCAATGEVVSRRYWLSSGEQAVASLIRAQCAMESFAAMTRHALAQLHGMPGFQACAELRALTAGALAATALRLEMSAEPECVELRQQLQLVLGGKRAANTRTLVDGLAYLFVARELLAPGRMH